MHSILSLPAAAMPGLTSAQPSRCPSLNSARAEACAKRGRPHPALRRRHQQPVPQCASSAAGGADAAAGPAAPRRLLLDGDSVGFWASWLAGAALFQWGWRARGAPAAAPAVARAYADELDSGADGEDDAAALRAWDRRFALRRSSVPQLQALARCAHVHVACQPGFC